MNTVELTTAGIDPIRRARAGLLRAAEPPAPALWALIERMGPEAAWSRVSADRGGDVETSARIQGRSPAELEEQISADFRAAAAVGARLIIPEDPEWPTDALTALALAHSGKVNGAAPPIALWARGAALRGLPANGVTIVGSRASTAYGTRVGADIGYEMAGAGWTVISGAAFGIDTAAHRSALATGAVECTVAVLACGIDRAYPLANRELLQQIARQGTVLSEYPPGTTPARHRFLVRNRIIAALGAGTVVIEAGRRSGTLSTAAAARALHRVVMAVPGPVTSAMSVGCNLLIADRDAQLVTGSHDVARILRPTETGGLFDLPQVSRGAGGRHRPLDGPDAAAPDGRSADDQTEPEDSTWGADAARVHDALSTRQALGVPDLARSTGIPGADVLSALAVLDLHGLAVKTATGWRRQPRPATRR